MLVLGLVVGGSAFSASLVSAETNSAPQVEIEEAWDINDLFEKPDVAITEPALEKASAAALAYLGEGRVTETELGDEESYYEVEVTLENGGEIDVQLSETFNVVGTN